MRLPSVLHPSYSDWFKVVLFSSLATFGFLSSSFRGCRLIYQGQAETNAWAWFHIALRPRKPEGSLGRTAQDGHLDSAQLLNYASWVRHSRLLLHTWLEPEGTDKRRFPQRIWLQSALVCPSRSSGAVVVRDVMKDALKQLNVPESVERVNWVAFGWLFLFFFFKCCFTSTETVRTVRDGKLRTSGGSLRLSHSSWALRSVSVLLYVRRDRRDEKLRTSTSSFTQLLSSEVHFIVALTLVTTTETVGTVGTGSPRRPPRLSHRF